MCVVQVVEPGRSSQTLCGGLFANSKGTQNHSGIAHQLQIQIKRRSERVDRAMHGHFARHLKGVRIERHHDILIQKFSYRMLITSSESIAPNAASYRRGIGVYLVGYKYKPVRTAAHPVTGFQSNSTSQTHPESPK